MVVDASAWIEFLLDLPAAPAAAEAMAGHERLHAPHLVDTEILSALLRLVRGAQLEEGRAGAALAFLARTPLEYHAHAPLTAGVWALRDRLSPYDATYVALADVLGVPLLTADARLARVAGPFVKVVLVA